MEKSINFERVFSKETQECNYLVEQRFYPTHYNPLDEDEFLDITVDNDRTDSNIIDLVYLQGYLENARLAGATHVCIDYHVDHDTYLIEGFKTNKPKYKFS